MIAILLACTPVDTGPGPGESDELDSDTPGPLLYACADNLDPRPWAEADDSDALYATAADFTVQTADGDWTLSEHWSGCDTFLVIPSQPAQATGWPDHLWDRKRDTKALFEALPRDTYVLFVSGEKDQAARDAELALLDSGIENFLEDLSSEDRTHWEEHIVRVTSDHRDAGGWLRDTMRAPNWGMGIDRFQRLRYIGSFANPERYNASYGWFEPDISMAANEAVYYNFEATRQAALDADGATVVPVFAGEEISDPGWAGVMGWSTVTLPDAATMASFDTLTLDHYLGCVGDGEYGTCPAWDYLNWLYLCDNDQSNCSEFGRYITTYHREGRWVHDVSSLLPLLSAGGEFTFAYYTQQPYVVSLDLRLSNTGKAARPEEITPLFSGGAAVATYNDREPIVVDIPADAARVELVVSFSGHGQVDSGHCAEFCPFDHHFYVNGVEHLVDYPIEDPTYGCMAQTADGTVPNQYGTWWYGRNGWCPGKEVEHVAVDISADVVLGAPNTFTYEAYQDGEVYDNGGANLLLMSWVVVSR